MFVNADFRLSFLWLKRNVFIGSTIKSLLFVFPFVISSSLCNAQAVNNLLASGGTSSNGASALSWSLGDLVIESYSLNDNSILNGSQFDLEVITALIKSNPEIQVYPNPVADFIKVKVDDNINGSAAGIRLFTLNGILLYEKEIFLTPEKQIEIELKSIEIPVGMILLEIHRNGESKLFKMVKI